ncbi:hypothetical protein FDG2_1402 [Candidatus Protofrankia californiensis]|uniref:Uncharacterized protein n=1 Tax=Candidatus Protofrankia californiensis TaxID=1839754 RepID=A0A1C3NVI5_9ACTN|nr:hypothetical protein FDG2_1402 [Candidatus Protofrankia californiensis]
MPPPPNGRPGTRRNGPRRGIPRGLPPASRRRGGRTDRGEGASPVPRRAGQDGARRGRCAGRYRPAGPVAVDCGRSRRIGHPPDRSGTGVPTAGRRHRWRSCARRLFRHGFPHGASSDETGNEGRTGTPGGTGTGRWAWIGGRVVPADGPVWAGGVVWAGVGRWRGVGRWPGGGRWVWLRGEHGQRLSGNVGTGRVWVVWTGRHSRWPGRRGPTGRCGPATSGEEMRPRSGGRAHLVVRTPGRSDRRVDPIPGADLHRSSDGAVSDPPSPADRPPARSAVARMTRPGRGGQAGWRVTGSSVPGTPVPAAQLRRRWRRPAGGTPTPRSTGHPWTGRTGYRPGSG